MGKQAQLSPEKYIITKARTLPIVQCYATVNWRRAGMAHVMVMRQHVNGNFTAGIYLVDLQCLGVKDTFYAFNISEDEIEEQFSPTELNMEKVEYNLAHNIIFAGHDFAMEFDIHPHKDFSITKFILEEDNDKIPLMEIPVGDQNGKPRLMVSRTYNYAPILKKLQQHAGEGNYTFFIGDEEQNEEDGSDDDDFDDDDFDDDDFDDDDFDDDGAADDDEEDEPEFLDFNDMVFMKTDYLKEIIEDEATNPGDLLLVRSELLLRNLDEPEGSVIESFETVVKKKDFELYEKKKLQWQKDYENNAQEIERLLPAFAEINLTVNGSDEQTMINEILKLLNTYQSNNMISYVIMNAAPITVVLGHLPLLINNLDQYPPLAQLFITACAAITRRTDLPLYERIANAENVEMLYPSNHSIHGLHHRLFWLIKSIVAIENNDKNKIYHYHNLLRISGVGGSLKVLYAGKLIDWLTEELGMKRINQ